MVIKNILIYSSAIFTFVAACLWFYACIVKVPPIENQDGMSDFTITSIDDKGNKADILKTAEQQTRWNKYAAGASAIAAFFQAILLLIN
ncbi:MAG: hypothetical protein ABL867_01095 [Rickettsiales bacterium]